MRKAVGFVEIKSIPVGIQTADEMVKAGNVELLLSTPICPGKYVIIVGGHVGPVKAAMSKAELMSPCSEEKYCFQHRQGMSRLGKVLRVASN